MNQLRSIVGYNWQYESSKTERHALSKAFHFLPEIPNVRYLGFPWATLIDRLGSKVASHSSLEENLFDAKPYLKGQKYVITVCQHEQLFQHQHIFSEIGVTHVFWPYAKKGQTVFHEFPQIKILPFPLIPNRMKKSSLPFYSEKRYLYSYPYHGSKLKDFSPSHSLIANTLDSDERKLVVSSNKIHTYLTRSALKSHRFSDVYITNILDSGIQKLMWVSEESLFSICPPANIPTIWEAIACGSIPVLLKDIYLQPGDQALWDEATLSCPTTFDDIFALPDRLETLARDEAQLKQKRHALQQLWMLYGPDCFIYDIQKLFLSLAQECSDNEGESGTDISYGKLLTMAAAINLKKSTHDKEFDALILGCSSRMLSDPSGFLNCYEDNSELRIAYKEAISSCNQVYSEAMLRNLTFKGIALN